MFNLVFGLIVFFGIHSISIIAPQYRNKLVANNEKRYKAVYALLAFLGLYLIAIGYSALRMEPVVVHFGAQALRSLVSLLMLVGFILFFAPYFPGKIKAVTKNPQLFAVILWSISHLLVNGNLADILLFGSFGIWAVIDLISMRTRQPKVVSPLKPSWVNDVIVVVLGTAVCGIFAMYLHGHLIGMPLVS